MIINPQKLTKDQKEAILSIYNTNKQVIKERKNLDTSSLVAENNLLGLLFGQNFFLNNYER